MGCMKKVVLVLVVILVSEVSYSWGSHIRCFCNSAKCLLGVCSSKFGCFIKVNRLARTKHAPNSTSNNQTSIAYGCAEDLKSNWCMRSTLKGKQQPPLTLCCKDGDLCNMPLRLKEILRIQNKARQERPSRHPSTVTANKSCAELVPALRLASVIIPSILIALVCFIAIALSCELVKYRKLYASVKHLKEKHKRPHTTAVDITTLNYLDSVSTASTVGEYIDSCCSSTQDVNSLSTSWQSNQLTVERATPI